MKTKQILTWLSLPLLTFSLQNTSGFFGESALYKLSGRALIVMEVSNKTMPPKPMGAA